MPEMGAGITDLFRYKKEWSFPEGAGVLRHKFLTDSIKYKVAKKKMVGLSRKWGWRILSFPLGEKAQEVF